MFRPKSCVRYYYVSIPKSGDIVFSFLEPMFVDTADHQVYQAVFLVFLLCTWIVWYNKPDFSTYLIKNELYKCGP